MLLFSSPPLASSSASDCSSQDIICNSTPYPCFCQSNLPSIKSSTIENYGRHFICQYLSSAKDILSLVKSFLKPNSSYFEATIQALEDCQILADLNVDFLSNSSQTINSTDSLNSSQAEDLQTLLSAALTNQETCSDGLQVVASDPSITNSVLNHLSNGTMLYSISLALCKHGWVPETKRERLLTERKLIFSDVENAKYNLFPRMSSPDEETNESITGRKLFQTTPGNVSVSEGVVVNQDSSGNFTTINDAVAAAPNNTGTSNGYFVIYVVAGVYNEYISIAKKKQNLMIIGDGINQTVITGSHSVVDGWTTFNSATFGKLNKLQL